MGLPGKKRTTSSGRRRASHFALVSPAKNTCSNCGQAKQPHRACLHCGYYRGRQVVVKSSRA